MDEVVIHLLEGFSSDSVRIRVDGTIVFESENVTTKLLLGLAEVLRTEPTRDRMEIEVELVDRGVSSTFTVDATEGVNVLISLDDDTLKHSVTTEPVGFG